MIKRLFWNPKLAMHGGTAGALIGLYYLVKEPTNIDMVYLGAGIVLGATVATLPLPSALCIFGYRVYKQTPGPSRLTQTPARTRLRPLRLVPKKDPDDGGLQTQL